MKINPQDINIQKLTDHVNLASTAKLHIREYQKKAPHKESNVLNFCNEVLVLVVTLRDVLILTEWQISKIVLLRH